ncbi:kelch-like protein 24 isoform X1 [Biomphalaria glabrata]|uniref:Kelch-like protein 24 isoform X1 n=2 Tax=Biomphalaria glabrata TaxID=6526 RepID=A0A9W2YPW5_BIOGL|nr:kelch-like protein 24 isoform X1 [Biomphalaria glabrata]
MTDDASEEWENVGTHNTMAISDSLAKSIVQNLKEEFGSSAFHDVIISVNNSEFKGHKFILSANSKYFKNIFTSERDRTSSAPIFFKNITPETFRLVLDCIYGGKDVLTAANLAEIWHAAVYLEIDFLYQACELYQTSRLTKENCVEMTNQATTFKSKKLKEAAWNMIVKEFKDISRREDFVLLESEDLLQIINSEDLATDSEDYVVNAILKWVQHSPETSDRKIYDDSELDYKIREKEWQKENCNSSLKKRKNDLVDMLKASRLCLASGRCLKSLLDIKVVAENKKCLSVMREALQYHLQPYKCGYHCPPQAIHRASSKLQNVFIAFNPGFYLSCRTLDGAWYQLGVPTHAPASATSYRQNIYSVGYQNQQRNMYDNSCTTTLYKYCTAKGQWKSLPGFANIYTYAIITLDCYLYAVSNTVYRLNLENSEDWETVGNLLISVNQVTLTTCGSCIVIFGFDVNNSQNKVQIFDTLTLTFAVYTEQLPDQMRTSIPKPFHTCNGSYILLPSGEVLELTTSEKNKVHFENKGKLIDRHLNICAAVTVKDHLLIAATNIDPQMTRKWKTQLLDSVKTVEIVERQCTFLLNAAVPKSLLLTKET